MMMMNFEVTLKYDKNNAYVTWRPLDIYGNVSQFLDGRMFHTEVAEKIKTHALKKKQKTKQNKISLFHRAFFNSIMDKTLT